MSRIMSLSLLTFAAVASVAPGLPEEIKLGMDTNYPPYASKTDGMLSGFGYDFAMTMNDMCDEISITVVETDWNDCWSSAGGGSLGAKVEDGTLHGCLTYTHTHGKRDELCDFSHAILNDNKAAGLLAMLDDAKVPAIRGIDDLSGATVVDVGGWAPTADTILKVKNKCTDNVYSENVTVVTIDGNDEAMQYLQAGKADAMFLYADQAEQYKCPDGFETDSWNCSLWEGLGEKFAYVQTGQFGHAINGTTLVLSKKGSGVPEKLDACIQKVLKTEEYHAMCVKHNLEKDCYKNEFFADGEGVDKLDFEYNKDTDQHMGDCTDGYCPCQFVCPDMSHAKCGAVKAAYKESKCCGSPESDFKMSRRLSGRGSSFIAEVESALKDAKRVGGSAKEKKLEQNIRDVLENSD